MSKKNHHKRNFYNSSRNNTFIIQRGAGQNSQIMLSISILVSGREETTEKCIASLDHLRGTVPCELILTDTGCPAGMQEWLQQKADKVLKFRWCNDFAAARNVGLRAATGQWFMFMDDDEWFENTDQIEEFFLSGEYRRYQAASYTVRNYANLEGTEWRDTSLIRMTRRRPDTRFLYPIHETLWPLLDVPKVLEDYVHHYGYANPDPEVQMAKRKRNLDLLLPAIEKDPHCMKHYLQGVAEYQAMNDYESGYKMADAGIANCIPGREENDRYIEGLYAAAVRMRLRAKRSLEVVRLGRDFLDHVELSDLAKASICGDLAVAYGELGEDKSCLQYLWEYLKWNKYFDENKEIWLQQETVILNSCFENFQYRKVMGWGLAASLSLGDADSVARLLTRGALVSWMDAARHWYVMTTPQRREKWQNDFRRLIAGLGIASEPGRMPQAVQWEEDGQPYSRVRQLYEVLTMAEEDSEAPERATGQENGQTVSAEKGDGRQERQASSQQAEAATQNVQEQWANMPMQNMQEQRLNTVAQNVQGQEANTAVQNAQEQRLNTAAQNVQEQQTNTAAQRGQEQQSNRAVQNVQEQQAGTAVQNVQEQQAGMAAQSAQGDRSAGKMQAQMIQGDGNMWAAQGQNMQRTTVAQGIGTAPKIQVQSAEEDAAERGAQKQSTEGDAVAREMAALAVQLKDRVSLLIDSGQYQAAAGIIEQLKAYFPTDEELLKLQERCANHVE